MNPVQDESVAAIAAALEGVGPRLKRLRTHRGLTLTGVAETTGISKSTLSRLETGGRRPTLELLLALSHAYRVPLDDLVGAPEEGDPRLLLKPGLVKGRTVIPLTRQPGGMQAWKIIIPTSKATPEPRAHDGHEWIYVLSGHMRFLLGDQDVLLGPGEVAAFDTTIPHWFRQHRRRACRDPQHLRATRRTNDIPRSTRPDLSTPLRPAARTAQGHAPSGV